MPSVVGRLDADAAHENVCRLHRAFFDAYLMGLSPEPDLQGSDAVTVTVYPPDR